MFRTVSRVLVVSVLALSLAVFFAPVAQARPHDAGVPAAAAQRSLIEEAISWLSSLWSQENQHATKSQTSNVLVYTTNGGSCIDPWGNPRPCP
jgi:hypothetical protein